MKREKMNKKATISGEVITFIPKIIFLIAVIFAFVLLVKVLLVTKVDVRQVEADILVNRILLSQNGISYYDESVKRLYPGVIDLKKFQEIGKGNPNTLDTGIITYGSDNPIISAKITLKQASKEDISIFYNKDRFDKWEPRALPGIKGAGAFNSFKDKKYVLVKEGDVIFPAVLEFFVVI